MEAATFLIKKSLKLTGFGHVNEPVNISKVSSSSRLRQPGAALDSFVQFVCSAGMVTGGVFRAGTDGPLWGDPPVGARR